MKEYFYRVCPVNASGLIQGGGPGNATQTLMTVIIDKGISDGFYSTGAALGVCFFVIVLIVSGIVNKLLTKWRNIA